MSEVKYTNTGTYTNIEDKSVEFKFRDKLTYSEMVSLIKTIAKGCFGADGEYHGYAYQFAVDQGIILSYTDIELPEDTDARYDFIYLGDMIQAIYNGLNSNVKLPCSTFSQIEFIKKESLKLVEYYKEKSMHTSKIDELLDGITAFVKTIEDSFKDVSPDDIKGFAELGGVIGNIDKNEMIKKVIEMADFGGKAKD